MLIPRPVFHGSFLREAAFFLICERLRPLMYTLGGTVLVPARPSCYHALHDNSAAFPAD